jgi:hypothetical protein
VPGTVADLEELFAADQLGRVSPYDEEEQEDAQYESR